jgi:hypothetical protein
MKYPLHRYVSGNCPSGRLPERQQQIANLMPKSKKESNAVGCGRFFCKPWLSAGLQGAASCHPLALGAIALRAQKLNSDPFRNYFDATTGKRHIIKQSLINACQHRSQ